MQQAAAISTPEDAILEPLPDLEREHTYQPLRVEGRVPDGLVGTYVQNGPAKWTDVEAAHWFDGLGALRVIRLENGAAQGALRFLRTPSVDDELAGRASYMAYADKGGPRERLAALFGASPLRNLANVNVAPWDQKLLALMEMTPPVEVSFPGLENRGETDLDGALLGPLQAHFHRAPARQTTYFIGQRIDRKVYADLYAFPDRGRPYRACTLELPGVTELHDFAVTEHHAILVLTPLWTTPLKLLWQGRYEGSLEWQPARGTEIVAISLDDEKVSHRFFTEPFFFWHVANAWHRGSTDQVQIDLIRYPEFARSVIYRDPDGLPDQPFEPQYARGILDLARETAQWEERWDGSCEFPRTHPAFDARRTRYTWMVAHRPEVARKGWWDRLVCLDTETGDVEWKSAGSRCAIGEPLLVPRSDDERDAWVLALVWDVDAAATCLGIWDGKRADENPVARVWFDQEVPLGLHACWIPA